MKNDGLIICRKLIRICCGNYTKKINTLFPDAQFLMSEKWYRYLPLRFKLLTLSGPPVTLLFFTGVVQQTMHSRPTDNPLAEPG